MDHLLSSLFGKKEVDSHLPQREGMKRVYLWQGMLGLSLSGVGPSTDFFFQSTEREHFRRAPRNMTKYTTSRSHWREHLSKSYLMGAMHDGTIRRRTLRICQREESYVLFLRDMIRRLGFGAWCYREGKTRELYVVEFSRAVLESHMVRTRRDKIDYVRGYFDAEGGLPSKRNSEPYIYFAQKNKKDLVDVPEAGEELRFLSDPEVGGSVVVGPPGHCLGRIAEVWRELRIARPVIDLSGLPAGEAAGSIAALSPKNNRVDTPT